MLRHTLFIPVVVSALVFFSCRKDEPIVEPEPPVGQAALQFDPVAGDKKLEYDSVWFRNSSNEIFTVTKFNYYISNIALKRTDGTYFVEPESYHLIKHVEQLNKFTITGIPEGSYTGMTFLIGVDSLRNVSGAQTGALDVENDMFWEWSTGYIFYKLEGSYFNGNTPEPQYAIHIGGFKGPYKCQQNVSLDFPATLVITKDQTSSVKLTASVEQIFDSPRKITIDQYYQELANGPKIFQDLAINYRDMFKVVQVTN